MKGLVIFQPDSSKNPVFLKIHIQISIHKQPHISWSLKGGTTNLGLNWSLSYAESTAQARFYGGRSK